MKRNLEKLAERKHDVLIVGGGIYGASAARELALAGLSVAVIDKGDFGGATSANSLKLIHGGLRYLQQLDLFRMRESITARRVIQKIAPHLVYPIDCVMPTKRGAMMKNPLCMTAALMANDIISFDRNFGLDSARRIKHGSVISKRACAELIPGMNSDPITGAAVWHDGFASSTERLSLGMVRAAAENGACAANYLKATGFILEDGVVIGVKAADLIDGQDIEIRARLVINNTGPWAVETLSGLEGAAVPRSGLAMGMNVVLKRDPISTHAAGIESEPQQGRPGRLLFFVPWRGRCMVGTYYRKHEGPADSLSVEDEDIESFLKDVNSACPSLEVAADDVAYIQAGFLPSSGFPEGGGEPRLRRHPELIDHEAKDGIKGLITVRGVKYTTAREVARCMANIAAHRLGRSLDLSRSNSEPLPGGDIADMKKFESEAMPGLVSEMGEDAARLLLRFYGSEYETVLDGAEQRTAIAGSDIIGAELLYGIRHEMAQNLNDLVFRRTGLAACEMPPETVIKQAAAIAAAELGWDADRTASEIAGVASAFKHQGN